MTSLDHLEAVENALDDTIIRCQQRIDEMADGVRDGDMRKIAEILNLGFRMMLAQLAYNSAAEGIQK